MENESGSAVLAKVAPPLAVSSMTLFGYGLSDWVLLATLVYTLVQLAILVYRFFKSRKR